MTDNENIINETTTTTVETNETDYLEALKRLKQDSVSKAEYDKLKAENKKLINAVVNGETYGDEAAKKQEPVDVNQLRKDLYGGKELSAYEYVDKTLKLREAIIKNGGKDPFLPAGRNIIPTDSDAAAAERVANVLQSCIDYAEGDSSLFVNELQRALVDTTIVKNRRK